MYGKRSVCDDNNRGKNTLMVFSTKRYLQVHLLLHDSVPFLLKRIRSSGLFSIRQSDEIPSWC